MQFKNGQRNWTDTSPKKTSHRQQIHERCSISLAAREVHIKTATGYHLTPGGMATVNKTSNHTCWRGCGEKEPSFTAGGDVDWCSRCGEQCGRSSKKLKVELQYDPALSLPGTYPKTLETVTCKGLCTPMLTAALFAGGKAWRPPQCPPTEVWVKATWCVHATEQYSDLRKDETPPFATTWANRENITLSEIRRSEKAKNRKNSLVCGI